jgi:death-on-curing protein
VSGDPIEYLDLDDLLLLATGLLGDPPPVRDLGLLGAAAARPRASAFGEDAYADVWRKAAALLQSIVVNHPLVDGNKRLGWLACAVFLDLNGIDPTVATNDEVVGVVMTVAAHPIDVPELAARLRTICGEDERPGAGARRL